MVKKYWGVRRKKRRVVVKYVRSPSFIERQYDKVKAINGYLYDTTTGIVNKSKEKAVNASTSVSLWCVNRLLSVSKGVEQITGANQQRAIEYKPKQNGTGITNSNASNGLQENLDENLKLSRPLNQIISDTFREEFNKIKCPANNVQIIQAENQKTQKLESAIQTTHKEIIDTLAEILKKGEELNKTLLGYKKFTNSEVGMRIMEGVKVSDDDQVRVLALNYKQHGDSVLYRLKKNWIIQFRKGPSLFGKDVTLHCNYPYDGEDFKRDKYHRLSWYQDEGCSNSDDTALYVNIRLKKAGSFHYYFTCDGKELDEQHDGSGFFLVDPTLTYGNDEELPLDCVQCQTVLAKSLGPFEKWEGKLRVGKESGYNMIHFTPIQELGDSNSSYSLKEQLRLNKIFSRNKKVEYNDVQTFIEKIRKEWKVVSICDIVLNHTANESQWLVEHPEATYNCKNCPYMRPAYLLDAALHQFSLDVKSGVYEDRGIPAVISTDDHLNAIRYILHSVVLNNIKLQEMYICDVNKSVAEFSMLARNKVPSSEMEPNKICDELKIIQDDEYKRLASKVDMVLALHIFNTYRNDCFDEETRVQKCVSDFKNKLDSLNQEIIDRLNDDLNSAIDNCIAGIRYYRVQEDGPKVKEITIKNPLIYRYFTDYGNPENVSEHEELLYSENSKYVMAHNGWVMNSDPLQNFALDSKVYLRRELIAWGDSVKLRYGNSPEDCPFLWKHMREYVERTARIFDGVRLDNCHSTPIPVAEYLLDCARKVRPDLYVVAELFTNSDHTDNIFVNRLGITSLIREAMSAWDSHEQGRLVYRYGGEPVGAFYQPNTRPLVPSIAHAMFLDLSHDNPSPIEKRSVFDLLPSAALVNMACCASGSNRGYDELVPHHIHVVDEVREYTEWSGKDSEDAQFVSMSSGIIQAKRAINDLHYYLGNHGFQQVYVDQIDQDIVAVTRHNPKNHESIILVAFTAFQQPDTIESTQQRYVKPLRIEGELEEIIFEASLSHKALLKYDKCENYTQDNKYINGYTDYKIAIQEHVDLKHSLVFAEGNSGDVNITQLDFKDFKPGTVVAVKVKLQKKVQNSVSAVRDLIAMLSRKDSQDLLDVIDGLTLADLNVVLYRCDQEERDCGNGFGAYDIPNFGPMVYCGLQGVISLLSNIRPNNDLGHPLCGNIRDGDWLINYIFGRLKVHEGTKNIGDWIEKNVENLKRVPRYLLPAYFDAFVTPLYMLILNRCYKSMSDFVSRGSSFVRGLALGSVQFGAFIKSAPLPLLSPAEKAKTVAIDGKVVNGSVTLSAGLPHFTTGYMRNWGRDTFIALRGLFILTGRYDEARYHILGYGCCLRHGLIPNLLDAGRNARYNCRDAVWWWLYCIRSYVEEVPNGESILNDMVSRIFPKDDSPALEAGTVDQPLHQVMQEALVVHFQGLAFRERNAGHQIDEHMSDRGFNNQIGVQPETGFIFGGNSFNCGTWMDKMGSSKKAGIGGKPATPRDGSAVELVGLSKSVISWLVKMYEKKLYPFDGVERTNKNGTTTKWSFAEWARRIEDNFERCFWINSEPLDGKEDKANLINKRGIYKDSFGASQDWTDFQLRCNFPITMVAAPKLFNPEHAWTALKMAEEHLLGPLGMKTLDNSDWNYCGDYDNSNDSEDAKISHGFNYHQGPEWVWPVGFYLRARLIFAKKVGLLKETVSFVKEVLSAHFAEMQTSPWRGLPELTNTDGAYCKDSSRTQAWSMSCILEVLHDLQKIESEGVIMKN